jgi:hypothetical protein
MTRRFQFSLGRLIASASIVCLGFACLRYVFPSLYASRPESLIRFVTALLLAGACFGAAFGLLIRRTALFALAGLILLPIIGCAGAAGFGYLFWINFRPR